MNYEMMIDWNPTVYKLNYMIMMEEGTVPHDCGVLSLHLRE